MAKDQDTPIEQSPHVECPNITFTDALDNVIEQSRYNFLRA